MLRNFRLYHLHILLLISLSLVVSIIWYRSGYIIAGGEESFELFNTNDPYIVNSPWRELATGYASPLFLPRLPTSLVVSQLITYMYQPGFVQACTFFFLLVAGLIGQYYFIQSLQDRSHRSSTISLYIAFFYLLNPFTLSQVWGRFIYAGIFLWSFLPWYAYLTITLSAKIKLKHILLMVFVIGSSSYIAAHPGYLVALFLTLISLSLGLIFSRLSLRTSVLTPILLSPLVIILSYFILNFWWLQPYFSLGSGTAASRATSESVNFDTLRGVSPYFRFDQTLRLTHSFLINSEAYSSHYFQSHILPLQVLLLFFVLLGLAISLKRLQFVLPLGFLVLLFLIDGSNNPIGSHFYQKLFELLPFAAAIRNPYEKLGIAYLLFYSALFLPSLLFLSRYRFIYRPTLVLLFVSIFLNSYPLFTTQVFGAGIYNAHVKPPKDYQQIYSLLQSHANSYRLVTLPMISGDGVKLNWPGGSYQGVEPTNHLLPKPVVSKIIRNQYYDKKYQELYSAFTSSNYQDFFNLTDQMHIAYFLLKNDLAGSDGSLYPQALQLIGSNNNLTQIYSGPTLQLYQLTEASLPKHLELQSGNDISAILKQSNTRYAGEIMLQGNDTLIFKETFHPNWKLYLNQKLVSDHRIAYDYANSWYLTHSGLATIEIKFEL